MRIGVLSDTHMQNASEGFLRALRILFRDVDRILHCGDWVAAPVVDALQGEGWDVMGVSGNMDPPEVQRLLPSSRQILVNGKKIGLVHGWGSPHGIEARLKEAFPSLDVLIFGHTHRAHWGRFGEMWLFNPGSAGSWGSTGGGTVGILEVGEEVKGQILSLKATEG